MFSVDTSELFDEDLAVDAIINGQPCRIMPGQTTIAPSDYDGVVRHNWQLTTEKKNLAGTLPTQRLTVDGVDWKVESLTDGGQIIEVYLSRRAT